MQDTLFEDSATFWSRSNARLGMDAAYFGKDENGNKTRPPVEFPCAMCGVPVMLERWPKDRQDVRCDACKSAVGGLLSGEERQIAQDFRRQRKAEAKGKLEGLPDLSDEDVEAIREMREMQNAMGNGRVGNRRGKTSGGGKGRRRKKGNAGSSQQRRKGGGKRRGGKRSGAQQGHSGGKRRGGRRRGGGGGGGGNN